MEGSEILLGYVTPVEGDTAHDDGSLISETPILRPISTTTDISAFLPQLKSISDYVTSYYSFSSCYNALETDIRYFPSKLGGYPHWLIPNRLPSFLICPTCKNTLTFLLQIYAPQPSFHKLASADSTNEGDVAFHRYIYVFICVECRGETVKALRAQLPRENPFYSYTPFDKPTHINQLDYISNSFVTNTINRGKNTVIDNGKNMFTVKNSNGDTLDVSMSDECHVAMNTCIGCGMPSCVSPTQQIHPKLCPTIIDHRQYSEEYPKLLTDVPALHRLCRIAFDYGVKQAVFNEYIIDVDKEEDFQQYYPYDHEKALELKYYAEKEKQEGNDSDDNDLTRCTGDDDDNDDEDNEDDDADYVDKKKVSKQCAKQKNNKVDNDEFTDRFIHRINQAESHILRYAYRGIPLWYSKYNTIDTEDNSDSGNYVPRCESCGSPRVFEFQILSTIVECMKTHNVDFGTIAIYTCSKNCLYNDQFAYLEEYVHVQKDTSLNRR